MQYVRLAGAAYLIVLGIQKLRNGNAVIAAPEDGHKSLSKTYVDGWPTYCSKVPFSGARIRLDRWLCTFTATPSPPPKVFRG